MLEILPGILEKDPDQIEEKLNTLKEFSHVAHIDVIDGKFIDNTTSLDPRIFKKYSDEVLLEAHLMVDEPINFLEEYAKQGFKRFAGQVEKMKSQVEFVALGQILGEVGLALDIDTPLSRIEVPYEDIDYLLLLGVKAGFSNQQFDHSVIEKIREASNMGIVVEVDGGIDTESIKLCLETGADRFVSTGYIFSGKPSERYQSLLSLLPRGLSKSSKTGL